MTTRCNLYILPPVDHAADEQTGQVDESIQYRTSIYQSPGLVEDAPVQLLNHSVDKQQATSHFTKYHRHTGRVFPLETMVKWHKSSSVIDSYHN